MKKEELLHIFRKWREDGESGRIIEAVLALPEHAVDDVMLSWLAEAYIDEGEYKKAIAVLDGQRERLDDDYKWHFRMGLALYKASKDEECEDDDVLRRNILERARVAFARAMNMNPPDGILESADRYMERIDDIIAEMDGEEDGDEFAPEMYDAEEIEAVEDHIKEYFGDFPTVFHELVSPDIHCDIYIVPPAEDRNYYTLLTVGMGAHIMDIPDELDADDHGRAELLICLPPDWKVGESSEEWFWPISLLKNMARLPINCETWLGWGHTVDHQQPFADNTGLCGSLLIYPEDCPSGANACPLPGGETVNFLEVIPLYREEITFKTDNDARALLERMKDVSHIVDVKRENCCEGYERDNAPEPIDCVENHSSKIDDKKLPLDRINGCNHIAIFLRWCIEHDLTPPEFYENRPDIIDGVKSGEITDLREFIIDYFDGELNVFQLSFLGAGFAHYYYNWDNRNPAHFFPADVDACAEAYFGTEKYNCEEFQDEAYMFVPFDENYYKNLSEYIDRAYRDFYPEFRELQNEEFEPYVKAAENLFGCECELIRDPFPDDIRGRFEAAVVVGKNEGFYPIIVFIDAFNSVFGEEDLAFGLRDGLNTFFHPVVIAKLPCFSRESAEEYLRGRFGGEDGAVLAGEEISAAEALLAEKLGTAAALLCTDGGGAELCLPVGGGKYLMIEKNGGKRGGE